MENKALPSQIYQLSFWEILDQSISHQEPRLRNIIKFYPSEASAAVVNEYNEKTVIGGCLRKSWFRGMVQRMESTNVSPNIDVILASEPFTPKELWKFAVSKYAETAIIDESKRAGVYETNSLRFEWELPFEYTRSPAIISGELDLAVFLPTGNEQKDIVGIEVKSISGYKGPRQVFGVKSKKGHWLSYPEPKPEHLLQAVLYHMYFCVLKKEYRYWKLAYLNREDGQRKEFDIDLVEVDVGDGHILHRVYVDGKPYKYELYAEHILFRYEQLHEYLEKDELPPRDFDLQYDVAKLQVLSQTNRLNKTDQALFLKKKMVKKGDWQCSYCPFKTVCYLPTGSPRLIQKMDDDVMLIIKDSINDIQSTEISEDDQSSEVETKEE